MTAGSPQEGSATPGEQTLAAAVITGASAGIGREIARVLASEGHRRILLVARGASALEMLSAELARTSGADVRGLALDLLTEDAGARIEASLVAAGWHAHILVNNAGIGLSGPFAEQDAAAMDRLLELNVRVPTDLMRRFLPKMVARRSGGVLNIASLGGYVPGPGQAVYYASKAYLISISKSVREEVRGSGVTITAAAPGPVETRFHEKMGADERRYRRLMPQTSPQWAAKAAVIGFRLGLAVVVPGPGSALLVLGARLLPNFVLAPMMAWLLGPGGRARG